MPDTDHSLRSVAVEDARQFSPSAARNCRPIREVLTRVLPKKGIVLEIGSGTGEHAVWQCQTNANQTAKCAKRIASGCPLTPLGQRGGAVLLEDVASAEVAIVVKVIVDRGVDGGEFLQGVLSENSIRPGFAS